MSRPDNLLVIHGFFCLLLFQFFANVATIPSRASAISDVSPSLQSPSFNASTVVSGSTRCSLPVSPLFPVSLESCQPVFRSLLLSPDAEILYYYHHGVHPITITDGFECAIRLDRERVSGEIVLSKRRIVDYAQQILLLCMHFGQGGWTRIDGSEEWIVIVSGSGDKAVLANEAAGVGGDGLSLESRDQ